VTLLSAVALKKRRFFLFLGTNLARSQHSFTFISEELSGNINSQELRTPWQASGSS